MPTSDIQQKLPLINLSFHENMWQSDLTNTQNNTKINLQTYHHIVTDIYYAEEKNTCQRLRDKINMRVK